MASLAAFEEKNENENYGPATPVYGLSFSPNAIAFLERKLLYMYVCDSFSTPHHFLLFFFSSSSSSRLNFFFFFFLCFILNLSTGITAAIQAQGVIHDLILSDNDAAVIARFFFNKKKEKTTTDEDFNKLTSTLKNLFFFYFYFSYIHNNLLLVKYSFIHILILLRN